MKTGKAVKTSFGYYEMGGSCLVKYQEDGESKELCQELGISPYMT